ncbi:Electron transport complex protein RnfA, partial [Sideroxydans sp. CL21]
ARIPFITAQHRAGEQRGAGEIPGAVSVHGHLQENRYRSQHGSGHDLRDDHGFRILLDAGTLAAGAVGYGVPAHPGLHPGHRGRGAVHRDGGTQNQSCAVPGAGHLPAADHYQLRRTGHPAADHAGEAALCEQLALRLRLGCRFYPGAVAVRWSARTPGAGASTGCVHRCTDRIHYCKFAGIGLHGLCRPCL